MRAICLLVRPAEQARSPHISRTRPNEQDRRRLDTAKPDRASHCSLHVVPHITTLAQRLYISSLSISAVSIHTYHAILGILTPSVFLYFPIAFKYRVLPLARPDPATYISTTKSSRSALPAPGPHLSRSPSRRGVECSQGSRTANTDSSAFVMSRRPRVPSFSSPSHHLVRRRNIGLHLPSIIIRQIGACSCCRRGWSERACSLCVR